MLAHLVCTRAWGRDWAEFQLNVLTDSEPTRFLIQFGRSRLPLRLAMARELVMLQFKGNFRIHSSRISTKANICADALSRLGQPGQWDRFMDYCTSYGVVPVRTDVVSEWFAVNEDW